MALAKLDIYDYFVLPGVIQIQVERTNDPTLVDILSEVDRANGRIYLEGHYYIMHGHEIHTTNGKTYLDLRVTETD